MAFFWKENDDSPVGWGLPGYLTSLSPVTSLAAGYLGSGTRSDKVVPCCELGWRVCLQKIIVFIFSIFSSLRQPICSTPQDSTWKLKRFMGFLLDTNACVYIYNIHTYTHAHTHTHALHCITLHYTNYIACIHIYIYPQHNILYIYYTYIHTYLKTYSTTSILYILYTHTLNNGSWIPIWPSHDWGKVARSSLGGAPAAPYDARCSVSLTAEGRGLSGMGHEGELGVI